MMTVRSYFKQTNAINALCGARQDPASMRTGECVGDTDCLIYYMTREKRTWSS